jgi:hypothetical protein
MKRRMNEFRIDDNDHNRVFQRFPAKVDSPFFDTLLREGKISLWRLVE